MIRFVSLPGWFLALLSSFMDSYGVMHRTISISILLRGSQLTVSRYLPPKSCMPRSAKTTMKRKRRKMREMMDFMEFIRETTRFLRDAQYLRSHKILYKCKKYFKNVTLLFFKR